MKNVKFKALCMSIVLCLICASLIIGACAEEKMAKDNVHTLTNIALNQSVSATSSYVPVEGFYSASFLVDGQWDTYTASNVKLGWNTDTTGATLGEYDPVDIVIDLDADYAVEEIVLKPMQWSNGDGFPRDYELQYSEDGKTWTTLASEKDVSAHADANTSVVPKVYNIDTTTMSSFRVHITRHSAQIDNSGSYVSAIGEIELYGYEVESDKAEEDLFINKYALCMNPGETDELCLTNGKKASSHSLTFMSDNTNVAKIDENGVVTAVAEGKATLTVTDTVTGIKYECPITVGSYSAAEKFQIVAFIPFFYEENINETTFDNLKKGGITNVELNFALDSKTITYENNLKTIKLAAERGLDVTVSESGFTNVTWAQKSDKEITDFVKRYSHLPSVSAYYIVDEPSDAVQYARCIALVKSISPYAVTHINFCGAYESIVTKLQNELVNKYGKSIDYVMYDAYTFRTEVCAESTLYSQLEYNRKIGEELGVKTATYIQSMGWNGCNRPNANAIRYQVYASLAAGVKQISYFCWQTPRANSAETYGPAVIDIDGNPTDLFEPVSKINAAVQALGPTLMKLECHKVYCTGDDFGDGYVQLPAGFFITPTDWQKNLAVSYMTEKDTGRVYSMVVNRDYNNKAVVNLKADSDVSKLYYVSTETGELVELTAEKDGTFNVSLDAGEGILITTNADYQFEMKTVTNYFYLKEAVNKAKAIDLSKYRDEGKDTFDAAIEAAENIIKAENSTQNEVDKALKKIEKAMSNLRMLAAEGDNIAKGATVKASDSYEDGTYFSSSYLTDGVNVPLNVSSHAGWSTNPYSVLKQDDEVTLTVDLKSDYFVSSVVICPTVYNDGSTMPQNFEIQFSSDGKNFTTAKTVEGLVLSEAENQYYSFDSVKARYVRVLITKHSDTTDATGGYLSQIGEIEVYGSDYIEGEATAEATATPEVTASPDVTLAPENTDAPTQADSTESPATVKKGCGSAVVSGMSIIITAAGTLLFIKKEKI